MVGGELGAQAVRVDAVHGQAFDQLIKRLRNHHRGADCPGRFQPVEAVRDPDIHPVAKPYAFVEQEPVAIDGGSGRRLRITLLEKTDRLIGETASGAINQHTEAGKVGRERLPQRLIKRAIGHRMPVIGSHVAGKRSAK